MDEMIFFSIQKGWKSFIDIFLWKIIIRIYYIICILWEWESVKEAVFGKNFLFMVSIEMCFFFFFAWIIKWDWRKQKPFDREGGRIRYFNLNLCQKITSSYACLELEEFSIFIKRNLLFSEIFFFIFFFSLKRKLRNSFEIILMSLEEACLFKCVHHWNHENEIWKKKIPDERKWFFFLIKYWRMFIREQ